MPEALIAALASPGFAWLAAASFLAGLVYGFAGFGAALVFMPLATVFVTPALAVAAFSVSALASFVTLVPGAWRVAERPTVALMLAACIVATPLGVAMLRLLPAEIIRTALSVLVLLTLAAMVAGWRLRAGGGPGLRMAVGALAGVTGGATGLNGPPVILFNLAREGQPVAVTRANLTLFLTLSSLSFLPQLWVQGLLDGTALWTGAALLLPYGVGTRIGAAVFSPERAGAYRRLAYGLIAAAGIAGLPVWGG